MEDGRKAAAAGGIMALMAALIGVLLAAAAKAAPPGAKIGIEVLDAQGNPLPHNSPVELIEGESYTVVVTATNMSTKAGEPWDVTFELVISAATEWRELIPITATMEDFAAGQTRSFSIPMYVPLGSGGETGQIVALLRDPAGNEIVRATEPFTIITIEIIYGATITIGT